MFRSWNKEEKKLPSGIGPQFRFITPVSLQRYGTRGTDSTPTEALVRRPEGFHLAPVLALTNPHPHLARAVMDEFNVLLLPDQHPTLSGGAATIRQGLQAC